jgi:hypothetical protein
MVRETRFHNPAFHRMARRAFGADRIAGMKLTMRSTGGDTR